MINETTRPTIYSGALFLCTHTVWSDNAYKGVFLSSKVTVIINIDIIATWKNFDGQ